MKLPTQGIPKVGRFVPFIRWPMTFAPLLLLGVFLVMALHVRFGLGHWPEPMFEDYDSPALAVYDNLLVAALLFALYAAPAYWIVLAAHRLLFRIRTPWRRDAAGLAAFLAGWVIVFIYLNIDPGRFAEWYLD